MTRSILVAHADQMRQRVDGDVRQRTRFGSSEKLADLQEYWDLLLPSRRSRATGVAAPRDCALVVRVLYSECIGMVIRIRDTARGVSRIATAISAQILLSGAAQAQDSAWVRVEEARIRRSPSASATVVGLLGARTGLEVLARQGGWTRVQSGSLRGWVRSESLFATRPAAHPGTQAAPRSDLATAKSDLTDTARAPALASKHAASDSTRTKLVPPKPPPFAQALQADAWEYRDPGTARQYAIYAPGGGHLYSAEYVKGAALLGASIVALYRGIDKITEPTCGPGFFVSLYFRCAKLETGIMLLAYAYGIFDAPKSAERTNSQRSVRQTIRFVPRIVPHVGANGFKTVLVGAEFSATY